MFNFKLAIQVTEDRHTLNYFKMCFLGEERKREREGLSRNHDEYPPKYGTWWGKKIVGLKSFLTNFSRIVTSDPILLLCGIKGFLRHPVYAGVYWNVSYQSNYDGNFQGSVAYVIAL